MQASSTASLLPPRLTAQQKECILAYSSATRGHSLYLMRGAAMSQSKITLKAIPDTALRRLRNTPSYFFLIWRWSMWFFAFIWIVTGQYTPSQTRLAIFLLTLTFIQS